MTEESEIRPDLEPAWRSGRAGSSPAPTRQMSADLGLLGEFGGLGIRAARVLGHVLERRVRGGSLVLTEAASTRTLGAGRPEVHLDVHDERAYAALFGRGTIGLAESYLAGWWDTDDLTGFIRILLRSSEGYRALLDRVGQVVAPVASPVQRLRPPSKRADRRNVQAHYDLPGEVFELMLDPTMAYSCAVFDRPGMSLEEAQRAKFDRLCQKLRLSPDDRLLEIGTGWGGLAIHAASRYGCRVTTTTISDAQREVASKRVAEAGLTDRVTVLGLDYRDLSSEGLFDKLVSVEMIEAVDWRRHGAFFRACSEQLAPDGLMALQAITLDDRSFDRAKLHDDFIRRMIFPGGCIPSLEAISHSVARSTDLTVVDVEDIGRHYAETLRRWRQNLDAHRSDLSAAGFEARFRRLWELYLSYCEAAFLERHISDVQVLLAKPHWSGDLAVRAV